jgi:lipid-binding SYLF domain-containing protein
MQATAANLSDMKLTEKEFTYSLAKGVIVDVSLTGLKYSVDVNRNTAIYGSFVSPAAILEGGMRPPAVMDELYAAIDMAIKEDWAKAMGPTGGDAEGREKVE